MDKFVRTSSHKKQKDHHGYIKCLKKRKKKSYLTSDKKKNTKKTDDFFYYQISETSASKVSSMTRNVTFVYIKINKYAHLPVISCEVVFADPVLS